MKDSLLFHSQTERHPADLNRVRGINGRGRLLGPNSKHHEKSARSIKTAFGQFHLEEPPTQKAVEGSVDGRMADGSVRLSREIDRDYISFSRGGESRDFVFPERPRKVYTGNQLQ